MTSNSVVYVLVVDEEFLSALVEDAGHIAIEASNADAKLF